MPFTTTTGVPRETTSARCAEFGRKDGRYDHAVDPLLFEHPDGRALGLHAFLAVGDQYGIRVALRDIDDRSRDRREEGILDIAEDQPDREGPTCDQAAGQLVTSISELGRSEKHALPSCRAHGSVVTQCTGRCRRRYSGQRGYFVQRGRSVRIVRQRHDRPYPPARPAARTPFRRQICMPLRPPSSRTP